MGAILDPANRKQRLIPLLKVRCELPPEYGYLTYVNFADPVIPAWPWDKLLEVLAKSSRRRPRPSGSRPRRQGCSPMAQEWSARGH